MTAPEVRQAAETPPPIDQDVRERIIREIDTSFFLEAGAGSGKTSVLVGRIAHLVRQGWALPQIVAITFTEKAAGELRERIRAELAAEGALRALQDVDAAPIQTIHAFAADILRERALDAGLDPGFRVLDQLQADLRFTQSWRTWLWSGDAPQSALQRALELGLSLRDIQLAAEQLTRNRDLDTPVAAPGALNEAAEDQQRRDAALADLTEALRAFVDAAAAQRRRAGELTYDDLLLEARNLLIDAPQARRDLKRRYRAILIDEFQDTDPLQSQIALLLSADPDTDDWTQARPGPGRLVLAGDPKQSIYRFRRADIDVYEQVRDIFARSPETCAVAALRVNFRAKPRLCAWQNRVLPRVLTPNPDFPRAQARWVATVPHRAEGGAGVAVVASQRQFQRADEARRAEAVTVANLIAHIHAAVSPLGQLPTPNGSRPPQFRDIAILLRTRTGADHYTEALDRAGIPWHFDSGQGFYQRAEIRAVAQLLQTLDDPGDEVAAIAVLKSPLIAASDQELLELRTLLGASPIRLDSALLPSHYQGRLREPIERLSALRAELHRFRLPELVDHVIRASDILIAQASGVRPAQMRQRQANLRMLVQRAARFADHDDALRPFVRWLSQRGLRSLPESESPTTEADDDAVRMLTIHQAKGLEFPVVILPKLQDQPGFGADFIVDRPNQRLEFRLGDPRAPFRTSGYAAALRRDAAYTDAEARRMLYVAATRARDWLFLPSFPADSLARRDSFHTVLDEASPHWLQPDLGEAADPDVVARTPRDFDAAPNPTAELTVPEVDDLRDQWRERHRQATDGQREIEARAPSRMGHEEALALVEAGGERGDPLESFSPLDFGAAVHEALEAADFDDSEVTRRRTARICRRRLAPHDEVLAHVERAIRSPLLRRAAAAGAVLRELPLATIDDHEDDRTTITEGVADLLFSEGGSEHDRWVLVDYKSDASIPPQRLDAYHRQIRQYASMLAAAAVDVAEAYLLLTATGEALPVPLI